MAEFSSVEPFDSFSTEASAWLTGNRQTILEHILSEDAWAVHEWHPLGFVVFRLSLDTPFPVFRMHVWLPGERQLYEGHPPIHSHARHMASHVLTGSYGDHLFEASREPDPKAALVQRYAVEKLAADFEGDEVIPLPGVNSYLTKTQTRAVSAGGFHTIEAGVIHEAAIPEGQLCVTLVLKGPLVEEGGDLEQVYGEPSFGRHTIRRRPTSEQTVEYCRSLVLPGVRRELNEV